MKFGEGGVALMGVSTVSVDGVTPATLVGVDAGGVFRFSTTAFGIQNVDAGAILQSVNYATGALATLDASGANRAAGGGSVWAAYLASGAGVGVRTNVAGLGPFPSGSLGDVSEDGQLVLIQDADGVGLATYSAAGVRQYVIQATLTGFSTVRARQGYFAYPADPGWWVRSLTTGAAASVAQRETVTLTIPVVINSRLYLVEYEPSVGVSVRLATASAGYVIPQTIGNSFNIDAVLLSGTTVRVGMSSGAGELPTELRVFDVNLANGAFQSGVTTSGSLVFTSQPALPPTTALPTNGFTGGSGSGASLKPPYQHPISQQQGRVTEVWQRFFDRAFAQAGGAVDVSNGNDVEGVLQPEHGGTGTTTGLSVIQTEAVKFTDESLLLGRGEGAGGGDGQEISLGPGLEMNGTVLDATGVGSFIPLVDGSEPPNFITDGSGNLILVPYTP